MGDVEIEAHSLVTLGSARVALGDARGVQDLEVALELVGRRGTVAGRAMTNLGWAYHVTGDLLRSNLQTVEAIELAEREGDIQSVWFTRNNLVDSEHLLGRWDEALRLIDLFSDAPQGVQLARVLVRCQRALILGARDRGAEAMEEIDGVLADMRTTAGDVQLMWPVLNGYGRLARRLGRVADANSALSELMDGLAMHESVGDPDVWQSEVVLELLEAGRADESSQIVDRLTPARGEMSAAQSPNVDSSRRRTSLPPQGSRRCRPSCDSWLPASSSARDVRPRPHCSSIAPGRSGPASAPLHTSARRTSSSLP